MMVPASSEVNVSAKLMMRASLAVLCRNWGEMDDDDDDEAGGFGDDDDAEDEEGEENDYAGYAAASDNANADGFMDLLRIGYWQCSKLSQDKGGGE